jgi:hypothetical protein
MKDLVVLVADKNIQATLRGALARPEALGIRPITFEFRAHPGRDGGARTSGPDVLATEHRRFGHALLVLDLEGSGSHTDNPVEVERDLDAKLRVQWEDCAKSVVIAPELDVWLWGSDNALREVFRWPLQGSIRDWLLADGFEFDAAGKPVRPKEALEAMVRIHRQARSSALYEKVAAKISLTRCKDAAFDRLRTQLRHWFGSR